MLTRTAAALVLMMALQSLGCSEQSPEPVDVAPATTAAPVTPARDAMLPAPTVVAESPPVASTPAVAPEPDDGTQARAAMSRLLAQGISVDEWEAAHQELVDLGPAAADALREALTSADPVAREWSASILALNVEAALVAKSELMDCLDDESGFLRANAAAALLLVPGTDAEVLPVLLDLTRSTDADLKRLAVLNLANLNEQVVPHLDQLTPLLSDADPEVVRPIVDLLGRLGPAAKGALPQLQQIEFEAGRDDLRTAVEQAVQQIESPDTAPFSPP